MLRDHDGQAAIEFLAAVAALLVAGLVAWQLILVGHAAWLSAHSARAASRAAVVGEDPVAAARSAVPRGLRRGLAVHTAARGAVRVGVPVAILRRGRRAPVRLHARTSLEARP